MVKGKSREQHNERLKATKHPTSLDIAWAAGFYEGEGWCGGKETTRVQICQVDGEVLIWCQELFGGHIAKVYRNPLPGYEKHRNYWRWSQKIN